MRTGSRPGIRRAHAPPVAPVACAQRTDAPQEPGAGLAQPAAARRCDAVIVVAGGHGLAAARRLAGNAVTIPPTDMRDDRIPFRLRSAAMFDRPLPAVDRSHADRMAGQRLRLAG